MSANQEVFDIIAKHLVVQNEVSEGPHIMNEGDFKCLYRGPNGLKCAVGILIPDEKYDIDAEDCTVTDLIDKGYIENPGYDPNLLYELQHLHDSNDPDDWIDELEALAGRYDLVFDKEKHIGYRDEALQARANSSAQVCSV